MNPDLILRYRRDEGHTCTGEIKLRWSDGSKPVRLLKDFVKADFNKMMGSVSLALNENEINKLIVERSDREGLKPFIFDNPMTELLRSDPVAALRMMNVGPIHIDLRQKKTIEPNPVFMAGHDTLAEAIGDFLYSRVRGQEVECPGCGMWSPVSSPIFECKKKCLITLPVHFVEKWARFHTATLIALDLPRYYFPRLWNPSSGWVSKEDLVVLFEHWKEKSK